MKRRSELGWWLLTLEHLTNVQSNEFYQHWLIGFTKTIKQYFFKGQIQRLLISVFLLLCHRFLSVQPSLSSLFPLILVSTVPFLRLNEVINNELQCASTTLALKQTMSGWCPQQRSTCLHILIIHRLFCCSAAWLTNVSSLKYYLNLP